MNYTNKLELLLKEILDQFEFDPGLKEYTFDTEDGPIIIGDDFSDLIDRGNDLMYGTDEDDAEEWLSEHSGYEMEGE